MRKVNLKSIILKSVSHTSKNSSQSNIALIRLKFLYLHISA